LSHLRCDREEAPSCFLLRVAPGAAAICCDNVICMKPSDALHAHSAAVRAVVQAHRAGNARVFGSVLHGRDTEDSDLDILIDPTPETTLFDISAIRMELRQILGVRVDVLTPNGLPDKYRAAVLAEARPV